MKRLSILNIVILILAAFLLLGTYQQYSAAQDLNLYRTYPFGLGGGQVGFFDQQSGRVYVYDNDLKECLYITEISELGQPMTRLRAEGGFYKER